MLITKFNSMIRNRLIWGFIAFLVVMAFVVWGTQTGGGRADPEAGKAGVIDGTPVGMQEFRRAYVNTYLSMCLSLGRRLNITEDINEMLNRSAWKRLAALRKARTMGMPVTNEELAAAIREQPFFIVDGQFSPEHYHAFTTGFLAQIGATESQFEEFMREELALNKLRYALAQSVWVPTEEIARVYRRLYDEFVVKYAALMRDELEHMAAVTEEDGLALFARDPERFIVPEKMSVKFVAFPFDEFIGESAVDDELLRRYYDEYIADFIESGSDEWDFIPALDEIEDEIRAMAAGREAEELALDRAYEFELMLARDRAGRAPSFEEAAAAIGRPVSTSAFFSVDRRLDEPDAGLEFNEMAFRLRPTPDEYFSYPVKGEKAFYVLGYHERREPRVPEFEEVKDEVMDAALEQAVDNLLEELAVRARNAIEQDLGEGIAFSDSAASLGLPVFTTEPFSVTSMFAAYDETDKSHMLISNAASYNAGELMNIVPIEDGWLIGYVDSREPADRAIYSAIRRELGKYVKQGREQTIFDSWQGHLLSSDRFEDLISRRRGVPEGWED